MNIINGILILLMIVMTMYLAYDYVIFKENFNNKEKNYCEEKNIMVLFYLVVVFLCFFININF